MESFKFPNLEKTNIPQSLLNDLNVHYFPREFSYTSCVTNDKFDVLDELLAIHNFKDIIILSDDFFFRFYVYVERNEEFLNNFKFNKFEELVDVSSPNILYLRFDNKEFFPYKTRIFCTSDTQ